jgi:hypothetical protein
MAKKKAEKQNFFDDFVYMAQRAINAIKKGNRDVMWAHCELGFALAGIKDNCEHGTYENTLKEFELTDYAIKTAQKMVGEYHWPPVDLDRFKTLDAALAAIPIKQEQRRKRQEEQKVRSPDLLKPTARRSKSSIPKGMLKITDHTPEGDIVSYEPDPNYKPPEPSPPNPVREIAADYLRHAEEGQDHEAVSDLPLNISHAEAEAAYRLIAACSRDNDRLIENVCRAVQVLDAVMRSEGGIRQMAEWNDLPPAAIPYHP